MRTPGEGSADEEIHPALRKIENPEKFLEILGYLRDRTADGAIHWGKLSLRAEAHGVVVLNVGENHYELTRGLPDTILQGIAARLVSDGINLYEMHSLVQAVEEYSRHAEQKTLQ